MPSSDDLGLDQRAARLRPALDRHGSDRTMMIVRIKTWSAPGEGRRVSLWCPGCALMHHVSVEGTRQPQWTWNGDTEHPTISPSILTQWNGWPRDIEKARVEALSDPEWTGDLPGGPPTDQVCHSFVRDGRWEFLTDSTHALAGQTVDCVPIPEGWFH